MDSTSVDQSNDHSGEEKYSESKESEYNDSALNLPDDRSSNK